MRLRLSIVFMVLCATVVAMSGCSSLTGGSSSTGKWLDFGNGVLNLDQTSRIIPGITFLGVPQIKFDEFELSLTVPAETQKQIQQGMSMGQRKELLDQIVNANMQQVRDFLNSNASYMRLK